MSRNRTALSRGVEWEFRDVVLSRHLSRNAVRQALVEMAEHGGWELDRLRIGNDGVRRVIVRRKIIRQRATLWAS
ncbi:hypothetical protein QE364_001991 [Nocardioides zeae]|uniref:Uncharacterized protein n=2 Tax=Nocardioides zeae TaxID=1457234 RepID=A0AAJ1U4Q5_9ACTN|nr:DUF5703 family protein [Nocardioides zeae]MDQ1104177.1 hypothetical protein [Nocardioides zeae]MDR6176134.1 hypothetical protein [Nocardioides zeae]MDR6210280.1 hypothetical protein [Nocardioides zeae]